LFFSNTTLIVMLWIISVITLVILLHKKKRIVAENMTFWLFCPLLFVIIVGVSDTFFHENTYIIRQDSLSEKMPTVISDVISRQHPYSEAFDSSIITIYETEMLDSYWKSFINQHNCLEPSRFHPQIIVVRGSVIVDDIDYNFFSLLQRVPLTNIYVVRDTQLLGADDANRYVWFSAHNFNVFWTYSIRFNRVEAGASGIFFLNEHQVLLFGVYTPLWIWIWTWHRILKKRRKGIDTIKPI